MSFFLLANFKIQRISLYMNLSTTVNLKFSHFSQENLTKNKTKQQIINQINKKTNKQTKKQKQKRFHKIR